MEDYLDLITTLLEQGTVPANFQVGCLLTLMQADAGRTHGKDFIGQVSRNLKKQSGCGASSTDHLLKCRKLSETWTQKYVEAVQKRDGAA